MANYNAPDLIILNDPYELYRKGERVSLWQLMVDYVELSGDEEFEPFEGITIPEALDRLDIILYDWQLDFDFIFS